MFKSLLFQVEAEPSEIIHELRLRISEQGFPVAIQNLLSTGNLSFPRSDCTAILSRAIKALPSTARVYSNAGPSQSNIMSIMSMGFTQYQAVRALHASSDNVDQALERATLHRHLGRVLAGRGEELTWLVLILGPR